MLIIVESPTKAKKIGALLKVRTMSTVGHFKDLPTSEFGVDLKTYDPAFVYHEKKVQLPDQLRNAACGETVMLAGDPDREGYAICRHIFEEIRGVAKECLRMEIYEVTEKGLKEALARAVPFEQTNEGLYHAFLGRRVGDRLVGYILSPMASRSLRQVCSVGRVQSPAVRLVVDREREIRAFKPAPYWVLAIQLCKGAASFSAIHCRGKFDRQADVQAVVERIRAQTHALTEKVQYKETRQMPKPPFTTVDLQAAAASRLRFTPEQTMKLAQALFDHGLTTYHRTDSVRMEEAFIEKIREYSGRVFGPEYVPAKSNLFKSKNSQAEAHEGIRPTHLHPPEEIEGLMQKEQLGPDHARLYDMIYRRAVASQMAAARYDATQLLFDVAGEPFKASGRVLKFEGFLKVYSEVAEEKAVGKSDDEKDKGVEEERDQVLPLVETGEKLQKTKETVEEKKTKPPGRFTLGSLVKELERLGIGRPSTYASITKNITDRGYVKEEKGKVVPLPSGEALIDYLRARHTWVIDYDLTSRMEAILDQVVDKKETWQRFCKAVHNKMGYAAAPVRSPNGGPSDAQLKYASYLAGRDKVEVPSELMKNGKLLSEWISQRVAAKGGAVEAGK